MPEEKFDGQEARRRALEAAPTQTSDALIERQENLRKMREESARIRAVQEEQERRQRDRQARHQEAARKVDEETRAQLFLRVMQAREQAKPQAEVPPVPVYTERQDTELTAEQAAGRRALEKYARRNSEIAAARHRNRAEEKVREDTTPGIPGFKP